MFVGLQADLVQVAQKLQAAPLPAPAWEVSPAIANDFVAFDLGDDEEFVEPSANMHDMENALMKIADLEARLASVGSRDDKEVSIQTDLAGIDCIIDKQSARDVFAELARDIAAPIQQQQQVLQTAHDKLQAEAASMRLTVSQQELLIQRLQLICGQVQEHTPQLDPARPSAPSVPRPSVLNDSDKNNAKQSEAPAPKQGHQDKKAKSKSKKK